MASIPSSIALTSIEDGASIVAADHRGNYTAIQTFINALQTILTGGTAGQVLQSDGSSAISWEDLDAPSGELDHAQATSDVSVTGTSSSSPTAVVTGNSVTYDGSTTVWVAVSCWAVQKGTTSIQIGIYKDGTLVNPVFDTAASGTVGGGMFRLRDTPASGSHTYSAKAWVDGGTGKVFATNAEPIHLTVVKV